MNSLGLQTSKRTRKWERDLYRREGIGRNGREIRYCGGKSNKNVLYMCMKMAKKMKFNQFLKVEKHGQCHVIPKDPSRKVILNRTSSPFSVAGNNQNDRDTHISVEKKITRLQVSMLCLRKSGKTYGWGRKCLAWKDGAIKDGSESWELTIGESKRQGSSCLSNRADLGGKVTTGLT